MIPEAVRIDRVCSCPDGTILSAQMAAHSGIVPTIAFVRADGWTLGATKAGAGAAYMTWPDQWVTYWEGGVNRPISEYEGAHGL